MKPMTSREKLASHATSPEADQMFMLQASVRALQVSDAAQKEELAAVKKRVSELEASNLNPKRKN
jgi:hypothetical protein